MDLGAHTRHIPGQNPHCLSNVARNPDYETDLQQKMLATNFSYGIEKDVKKLEANDNDHTKWSNPLESRLPNTPSMKLFCVYGHGKDTEVGCPTECGILRSHRIIP